MKSNEYDIIVAGASNAGGMAAIFAAKNGAKVLVIDKAGSTKYLYRDTIASVDSKAQKAAGVKIDKTELINFIAAFNQYNCDMNLLRTWVENSAKAVDFIDDEVLKPHGAHMMSTADAPKSTYVNKAFASGNEVSNSDDSYWEMNYGQWMIEKAEKLGAEFNWHQKLEHLITKDGKVIGAQIRNVDTDEVKCVYANKGVIICTGGYGSNLALMQKWDPLGIKKNAYSDSQRDDGSGIVAAMEVGAVKDEEPAEIIFNRAAVPVGTNAKTFYKINHTPPKDPGYLWLGSYPFLKVNLRGERFFNESSPYQYNMNAAMKQPGYLSAMIWNEKGMSYNGLKECHTLGCSRLGYPGIFTAEEARAEVEDRIKDGLVKKADTIEELAKELNIPADNLKKTVSRYNELCQKNKDDDFGKESNRLHDLEEGPYYGAILTGRLLATLDGLRINSKMEVLNEAGNPIEGLYAAGNCSGGFFWGSYPDRVPGLTASHAQTFGMLAGINAANR
ncbi:FAD-dependent oxidoreductase [Lactobacillus mulieris]|uniref:FAD-binding protein n=1 Tax=Lactobacillus mulieris TaxID=2508708 RepID=A0AAW5WXC3_9LACO|nr:FAD-binding protein [Lactobacillus mulieris]MCZ3621843.1 FAD-binding protein [Lactobacillus mulieris]MCZ3623540.1 FAD-binding protein [Lactobacillus mulieris]MCZ3635850.1 FAD-binding protein [Lactobacillus mulieris]MCZ3689638.1 FAD-binding protein [Lactobacillus mulieris]MCZ3695641.1 FAD-binding protein [Lactobacillus mulieris]